MSLRSRAITAIFLSVTPGCDRAPSDNPENPSPSPNASILPAPLAPATQPLPETLRLPTVAVPLRLDQPLDADPLTNRELPGVTLEGEWHYADLPGPPKAAEVNLPAIENARKLTALRWTVELSNAGRLRVLFRSRAFPLGSGVELRARSDGYGHVLVWPHGDEYRVLPAGAVRTLLGERRTDAIPLVQPEVTEPSEGPRRTGYPTQRREMATRTGRLTMEQVKIATAGEGAILFCRLLSEIIAIDPAAAPCVSDEVPVRAQYAWPNGNGIVFEVSRIDDKVEHPAGQLMVPPAGASYVPNGLPGDASGGLLLTRDELAAFRTKPIETGSGKASTTTPTEGLVALNGTELLRYLYVDGVPVAWVSPYREQHVIGPPKGRYVVQWRTFLGDAVDPPKTVDLPARISFGISTDGGAAR
jgi:hypothetical protein